MLQKPKHERNAPSGLQKEWINAVTQMLKLHNRPGALTDRVPARLPRGSSSPLRQWLKKKNSHLFGFVLPDPISYIRISPGTR